jgi:hypothetical protein
MHPAALAKVNRPWLPAMFPCERLFQRLDELADRPRTWIGAPGATARRRRIAVLLSQALARVRYYLGESSTGQRLVTDRLI